MLKRGLKLYFNRELSSNVIEMRIIDRTPEGMQASAGPLMFTVMDPSTYVEPCVRLSPEEAQEMMDGLWTVGCRPSEGSGSAGMLAATQAHLQDMRTLVFKKDKS